MLNICNKEDNATLDLTKFKSGENIMNIRYYKYFNRFLLGAAIILFVTMFLPWTQNISGQGIVTTLNPSHRPQHIESPIPGRIEQWYIQEGQEVKKGDTILRISEIKSDYFDDKLVERTGEQIKAKTSSVASYDGKVEAINRQIEALKYEQNLKTEQTKNKLMQKTKNIN